MALNEAYGQTDLAHEPNRLRRMLQSPNPRDRETAQLMLEQLNQEHTKQLQQQDFYFRQNQSAQDSAEHDQTRRDINNENHASRKENQAARQEGLKEAHDTGRAQQLQMMIGDPNLKDGHAAYKAELNRIIGINVPSVAPGGAKGEYGPGGAPKGSAPTTTSYTPPTGAFTNSEEKPITKTGTQLNVDGGRVYGSGAPVGYDVNTNTGDFIPKGQVGTINGVNATQFLVDHANKTGIRPEEPKSLALYDQTKSAQRIAEGNPPPNDANPVATPVNSYTPPANAFVSNSTAQATPIPGPNPTPTGTPYIGPFSELNVTAPAIAPAPTPFIPPAVPTPPPILNPQASNDRQDLLRDTENTFYGGGNVPAPSPTPTPQPQRLASVEPHPMTPQALAYLRLLGLA